MIASVSRLRGQVDQVDWVDSVDTPAFPRDCALKLTLATCSLLRYVLPRAKAFSQPSQPKRACGALAGSHLTPLTNRSAHMEHLQCDRRQTCDCRQAVAKGCSNETPPHALTGTRETLARVITAWLKAHGHPLKCVARRLGVAESTICQWARGKRFPGPDNLDDLARCAGVPTLCLLCPRLMRAYESAALAQRNPDPCRATLTDPAASP